VSLVVQGKKNYFPLKKLVVHLLFLCQNIKTFCGVEKIFTLEKFQYKLTFNGVYYLFSEYGFISHGHY